MTLINCDLGECLTPDPDSQIMPLINMANIACGGHVGNEASMCKTIQLAKEYNVTIGAHPSYQDLANFGRVSHDLSAEELYVCIKEQLIYFKSLCEQERTQLSYIKPHGALYHDMMQKPEVLNVICRLIKEIDLKLSLVVQAGLYKQEFANKSLETGINFFYEAFADRGYQDTKMIPRTEKGAMLMEPVEIIEQFDKFSNQKEFRVDTICFHSDHSPSVLALQLLKDRR